MQEEITYVLRRGQNNWKDVYIEVYKVYHMFIFFIFKWSIWRLRFE